VPGSACGGLDGGAPTAYGNPGEPVGVQVRVHDLELAQDLGGNRRAGANTEQVRDEVMSVVSGQDHDVLRERGARLTTRTASRPRAATTFV